MTGNWLIGGSMKVNRVLTDKEVERINKAAGLEDLPRDTPFKKKDFGFKSGGMVAPDEWMAEEHVNYAKGGQVKQGNPFDYQNKKHTMEIARRLVQKHKEFDTGEHAQKHMHEMLGTGNWRYIEDPRMQAAIREAGHDSYFTQEKTGKQSFPINKAVGGPVQHPSLAHMRMALAQKGANVDLKNVGVNEAPDMAPKHFFPPDQSQSVRMPSPGGVSTPSGMPIGGIDMSRMQPGQQLMPQPLPQQQQPQQPQQGQQPGQPPQPDQGQGSTPPMGNMLSLTPQGQALNALGGGQQGPKMAKGGSLSVDTMKAEMAAKKI
jgi:hypothetical protein